MWEPSENLRSRANTFHSRSEGGFFCGLLKNISYSIFSRRSCDSNPVSSSSTVMNAPTGSLGEIVRRNEVPGGHKRDRTKVREGISGLLILGNRLLHRHFLDHGQHQLAIAVVQAAGVAANLAEET